MNLGEPDFGSLEFSMADQMFWGSSQGPEIEEHMEGGEIADVSHHRHHQRWSTFFKQVYFFA